MLNIMSPYFLMRKFATYMKGVASGLYNAELDKLTDPPQLMQSFEWTLLRNIGGIFHTHNGTKQQKFSS